LPVLLPSLGIREIANLPLAGRGHKANHDFFAWIVVVIGPGIYLLPVAEAGPIRGAAWFDVSKFLIFQTCFIKAEIDGRHRR